MASWILGIGGLQGGSHLETWGRFTFASGSLMPAAFLAFSRYYPTPSKWPNKTLLRGALLLGCLFALFSQTTPLIIHDVSVGAAGLSRKTGALYPFFSFYFLLGWSVALVVFLSKWRNASGISRAQLQYLGAGLIIPVAGAITTNLVLPLLTGRSTYSWLGPYFSLLLVMIVGHAIIRHRLMDLRLVINRGLAHLLVIGAVSALGIGIARLMMADGTDRMVWIHTDLMIVAVTALIMISAPAHRLLTRLVDPYLFRGRIDYDIALRAATHRLSRLMQLKELAEELKEILTTVFVPESFVMAVRPREGGKLEQVSAGAPSVADLLSVAALIIERPQPCVLLVNPQHERGTIREAHETLHLAGIEVVLALARREELSGIILLGPRRSGDPYFIKDLDFVESLSQLASIALENSLLYRQRIQMLEYSERLLESLEAAVVAVDVAGKITSFNPAAEALLNLHGSVRGAALTTLPTEVSWALTFALSGTAMPSEVEVTIDNDRRGPLSVVLSTAVLHDDKQQISGALAVVTDLSTVKTLERNQRRMEHLALMARFYAGIAHEIRSPLAAISNFVAMLPDRFGDPEYRDTAARLLPMEVARIVRLADRLRLMAPSEDGKLGAVALQPLLSDIVALQGPAAAEQSVRIALSCPEGLPKILGDPAQLVQLFVNLINNAVEAMATGGMLAIEAHCRYDRAGVTHVLVRIIDEGAGIDPHLRGKIFDPFFTTKASGTGLGLSICREIADYHGARLQLTPRAHGHGTVAEVEFPALTDGDDDVSRVALQTRKSVRMIGSPIP
jgi:signal transduction histidine kinase